MKVLELYPEFKCGICEMKLKVLFMTGLPPGLREMISH